MSELEKISIFSFNNYREYLARYLEEHRNLGESVRALSRRCGISSPNYLQQVILGKRNLTTHFAAKFAEGAKLTPWQTNYLLALVAFEVATSDLARQKALESMWRAANLAERRTISDADLRGNWANPLIWETAKTKFFSENVTNLGLLLRNIVSKEEIEFALNYLRDRGYLATADQNDNKLKAKPIDFKPSNDIRRIDLQRSHSRFLQLAQHRLNDGIADREYQGLTVATRKADFEQIRQRCRDFIQQLNHDFAVDADGDDVIRIQLAVFKLFDPTKQ